MSRPSPEGWDALEAFRRACDEPEPASGVAGLADLIEAGCAARALAPVPLGGPEGGADAEVADPAQVRVVRDRLGRLGYVIVEPASTEPGRETPGLTAALREFQREAGLPDHGRIELETWNRLRELFDFETELRTDWCFVGGRPRRALLRAERLRLAVLGFPVEGEAVVAARGRWLRALAAIGWSPDEKGLELTPVLAERLFDHDGLVGRLAKIDETALRAWPKERRRSAEALMVCVAKIELWLHGYNVVPDGSPVLREQVKVGRPGAWRFRIKETPASNALRSFLDDTEVGDAVRFASASKLRAELPVFFRRAAELRAEGSIARENDSAVLVAGIEERLVREPDLWKRMREAGAQMANALFDGVRRVFAWVGRLLRGAAKALARLMAGGWLGNLYRALHYFAGAVTMRVRKAVRVFCSGMSFLFSANQSSDPRGQAVAMRGGDFDLRCMVDSDADAATVGDWGTMLVVRARHLGLATRMLGFVRSALVRWLRGAAAGPLGWLALVLGLARLYSDLRTLGRELDEVPLA